MPVLIEQKRPDTTRRFAVSWEARTLRRTEGRHGAIGGRGIGLVPVRLRMDCSHLVPHGIVLALLCIVLVEVDDVDCGLRVLLLLLLGNAVAGQHALPLLREALDNISEGAQTKARSGRCNATYRELARLVVNADVGDMHGIGGRGDGRPARRAHEVAHKAGEGALLLRAARIALLRRLALVAVAVAARALSARWRGIHLAGEGCERGRLAELGRPELGGLVRRVRVLGQRWPRCCGGPGSVQSLLDDGSVEGRANRRRREMGKGRCRGRIVRVRGVLFVDGCQKRGRATKQWGSAWRGRGGRCSWHGPAKALLIVEVGCVRRAAFEQRIA